MIGNHFSLYNLANIQACIKFIKQSQLVNINNDASGPAGCCKMMMTHCMLVAYYTYAAMESSVIQV